jgi:hypothetical protein
MEDERSITITYDSREEAVEENENIEVVKDAALTKSSEVKRQAIEMADRGDHKGAAGLMQANASKLEKLAKKCDNDDELLGDAYECEEIVSDITANEGMTSYMRKSTVARAYAQTNQQGYVSGEDSTKVENDNKDGANSKEQE